MADAFPISGNIEPKAFPFLLMDLHRQGATGSLKVDGPSYPKALYYRAGRILFGSSNDPKDQLGSILIENGKITAEQLDDVNSKVGPGNPLAKVLAESGYVNQRELNEAARTKVERILSDVLSYTTGSFEFEDGVLPKGAVDLKLSTEKLTLAAVKRLSDRGFVLRHLDSLGVVLSPTPEMASGLTDIRTEAGELAERFDGARTLKEAASLTRLDEFDAAKVACALLFLGLVKIGAAPGAAGKSSEELDLAQTAQMAFDGAKGEAPPAAADAPPFFTPGDFPEAEQTPTPAAGDAPPLGFDLTATEPGGIPVGSGFAEPEPTLNAPPPALVQDPEPAGFAFNEPEPATLVMPDAGEQPIDKPLDDGPEIGFGEGEAGGFKFTLPEPPPPPRRPSAVDVTTPPLGTPGTGPRIETASDV